MTASPTLSRSGGSACESWLPRNDTDSRTSKGALLWLNPTSSISCNAGSALHQLLVVRPQTAGAYSHLLRRAVYNQGSLLNIRHPPRPSAALGVADIVPGLPRFKAHLAYCHISPLPASSYLLSSSPTCASVAAYSLRATCSASQTKPVKSNTKIA